MNKCKYYRSAIMSKKTLSENLFGKIMGKLLQRQSRKVLKLLQKDPVLAKQVKKTDAAIDDLKKALKKAEKSSTDLMIKRGLK